MQQKHLQTHLRNKTWRSINMRNFFLALASIVRFFALDIPEMKDSRTQGAAA